MGNGPTLRRRFGRVWFRAAVMAVSVVALIAAIVTRQFAYVIPAVIPAMFVAMTFGATGRLSEKLQGFRGRAVVVHVWGQPLPMTGDEAPTVTSIWALGAGLHFGIRVGNGSARDLKVAQPAHVQLAEGTVTIAGAKYVQWVGRSLTKVPGAPALTISLIPATAGESRPM